MTSSYLQAVQAEELAPYGQAASCTLLAYEAILGLNDEMRLMWSKSFHPGKLLYFLIKYLTLIFFVLAASISLPCSNTDDSVSAFSQRVPWVANVIITLLTEMPLQLRLYALYQAKKNIKFALLISLFVTIVPMLAVAIVIIRNLASVKNGGESRKLCATSDRTRSYTGFWVPALVNEAFLFCLAVYKGAEVLRERRELGFYSRLKLFIVRGSVLYFFVVFAALLLTEIAWVTRGVTYVPLAAALTECVASLMSQHLLLGLRRQLSGTQVETTTLSSFFAPANEPSHPINQGGDRHNGSISEGEDEYLSELERLNSLRAHISDSHIIRSSPDFRDTRVYIFSRGHTAAVNPLHVRI